MVLCSREQLVAEQQLNITPARMTEIVAAQQDYAIIPAIDKRLIEAQESADIILWTRVKKEVDRQIGRREEEQHRRRLEKTITRFKMAMTVGAFLTGVAFLVPSFGISMTYPGLFMIGTALYQLIPGIPQDSQRTDGDDYE
jgi:hypothetical protein